MRDYFDVVTDLMAEGYSASDAGMYAENGIRPEPDDEPEEGESQGCTCRGAEFCTC